MPQTVGRPRASEQTLGQGHNEAFGRCNDQLYRSWHDGDSRSSGEARQTRLCLSGLVQSSLTPWS